MKDLSVVLPTPKTNETMKQNLLSSLFSYYIAHGLIVAGRIAYCITVKWYVHIPYMHRWAMLLPKETDLYL